MSKRFKKISGVKGSIKVNESYEGERIEDKIRRVLSNNEPISDGAPLIFTERKDGVRPEYDIRTDRWEIAVDAMDYVSGATRAKRDAIIKPIDGGKNSDEVGGAESTQATD